MAVFPESMDPIEPEDTARSLRTLDEYVRYMTERIEFGMRNVTKSVNAAGISSTEMYILMVAMDNRISALESALNGLRGTVTGLQGTVTSLQGTVTSLQGTVTSLQGAVTGLGERMTALEGRMDALEERVDALENGTSGQ